MKEKVQFDDSVTKVNLARAFAGECMDGARYQFIARQAKAEGHQVMKMTFKTLAKNEMAHAKMFYDLIVEHSSAPQKNIDISAGYPFRFGTLLENFEYSIDIEITEGDNIYPAFAKVAKDEGFPVIAKKV